LKSSAFNLIHCPKLVWTPQIYAAEGLKHDQDA
jgi:hypothetical protein